MPSHAISEVTSHFTTTEFISISGATEKAPFELISSKH